MKTNISSRKNLSLVLVALAVIPFLTLGTAHGATVEFRDINDAVPGMWFDSATTVPDGDNVLSIGLDNFAVTATGGGTAEDKFKNALDTIAFTILAPDGYTITEIAYTEGGTASRTGSTAFTLATGSWTVDGVTGAFENVVGLTPTSGSTTWSLGANRSFGVGDMKTSIAVIITNQITAVAMTSGDVAMIGKSNPTTLEVTITPIPIPGAALLFGSGLIGIIAWRRRSTKS
jgi:hypothetical protein